jgi:hypothetical protein
VITPLRSGGVSKKEEQETKRTSNRRPFSEKDYGKLN